MRQRRPIPLNPTPPGPRTLGAVPCAVLLLCCAQPWALAQTTAPAEPTPAVPVAPQAGTANGGPVRLRPSPLLQEKFADDILRNQPTFIFGDRLSGRPDLDTIVDGNAELRRTGSVIRADRIEYYQPDDLAKARGNVRINREGNVYEGKEAQIKVDAFEGYFTEPTYQFLKNGGHGEASRIDFIDNKRSVARNASYTTCTRRPGPSWLPDWVVKASQVSFDTESDTGVALDAQLRFKDVPIMALPYLSFPLSDARKSGWLPPSLNIDNTSGVEVMMPYYLNIAPNRDATLFPSVATKRGLNLGGEFRYLEQDYNGTARLDWMPVDKLRSGTRWGVATNHTGTLYSGIPAVGNLGLNLSLNRVSDDNYWSDFPRATSTLTQRLLANDGNLSWAQGPWSLSSRVLKWQTLQVDSSIIIPPYDRLPQVTGRYTRTNWGGFDVSTELDYTRFRSQEALTLQPNGQRSYALAQVSRPWLAPGYYITPKVQLHTTSYQFDTPLTTGATRAQRVVPTASLDSGLVFERDASFFGRKFTQTLEPRAFYTYTPFRDQSSLPNYDSGANDFNFASIYSENSFVGNDRFADNNLLTVGATSRLLDPATGAEAVRLAFAQRIRFSDQKVTLPGGTPDTSRLSDQLYGATVNWSPHWSTDAVVQYNPKVGRSERSVLSGRYSPSDYRVFSAAYRYTKGLSEQVDFGWQWPVNDLWGDKGKNLGPGAGQGEGRWYSVGRLNYSLQDRKIVDTVLGFEYDAGCWLGRVVFERLQTTTTTANKRILFQLEFVGFARVGSNPLRALKENVPRYQYLREKITTDPSRFSNYD
jgi:LPS-assembly protein